MARARKKQGEVEDVKRMYEVTVFCHNCRWSNTIEVECGLSVMETECPNCGCFFLATDWRGWPEAVVGEEEAV